MIIMIFTLLLLAARVLGSYVDIQNNVFQFTLHELIDIDHRWVDINTEFGMLCTKPFVRPEQTQQEKRFYKEAQHYPLSFKQIDDYERIVTLNTKKDYLFSNNWAWRNGKWLKYINNQAYQSLTQKMNHVIGEGTRIRGIFYYPPASFREWHSNKYDTHGWRIYLVRTNGLSFFNYLDRTNGKMHTKQDGDEHDGKERVVLNVFKVGSYEETLYHSVVSTSGDRWSIGFFCEIDKIERFLNRYTGKRYFKRDRLRLQLQQFLSTTSNFGHMKGSLRDHLLETYDVAKKENGDRTICLVAGLHSVYGTTIYKQTAFHPDDKRVARVFGEHVDRLIHLFGTLPRHYLRNTTYDVYSIPSTLSVRDLFILRWVEYANMKSQHSIEYIPALVQMVTTCPLNHSRFGRFSII
jgi:hypothetical protein